MQKWGRCGWRSVAPDAVPSFVTDAFAPGRQIENIIVIPIEDEDFQAVYYFSLPGKGSGEISGAHYPSSGKEVSDTAPLNGRTETGRRSQAWEGKPHRMGICFFHVIAKISSVIQHRHPIPDRGAWMAVNFIYGIIGNAVFSFYGRVNTGAFPDRRLHVSGLKGTAHIPSAQSTPFSA